MKNGVSVFGLSLQHLDCLGRWQNNQFDLLTLGFTLYVLHEGQSAVCTTADDELVASPDFDIIDSLNVFPMAFRVWPILARGRRTTMAVAPLLYAVFLAGFPQGRKTSQEWRR